MSHPAQDRHVHDVLVSYFRSGGAICSRSVSDVVLSGKVDIPAPTARLLADWDRQTALRMGLESGDVEVLSLARARACWPGYRLSVQAVSDWMCSLGLPDLPGYCDVALMACRGARYHHDGERYGGMAFCNLFLSEDKGLDVFFPVTGLRIPLTRGTTLVFDTCQPHAVVVRGNRGFDVADFPADRDCTQLFLTWELPITTASVGRALRIDYDVDPATSLLLDEEQVRLNGARAYVCQDSGLWALVRP